jgi:hypothetical protein
MISDGFSLIRGGPVYRLMHAIGAIRPDVPTAPLVAVLLVGVAFLPLVGFAIAAGMLMPSSGRIALLGDHALIARLLVAIPVLVLAAAPGDDALRVAMRYAGRSGLVPANERQRFEAIVRRGHALRDSNVPELVCAALAVASAFWTDAHFSHVPGLSHWALASGGGLSAAGQWFAWVSAPVFRFVSLIWLWRFLLWAYVLWRLSRLHLALHATHPDGAGGLGFLAPAQTRFAVMSFAGGCIITGNVMVQMVYAGQQLPQAQWELIGYIVGSTALVIAPLLCMLPKLARVRRHDLHVLGELGQGAVEDFGRRWKRGMPTAIPPPEGEAALLDSPNPSAIADFTSMYATARSMAILPINRMTLLALAFMAALPMLPAVLTAISADELLRRLVGVLA